MAKLTDLQGNYIDDLDSLGGNTVIDTRTITLPISATNGEVLMQCQGIANANLEVRGTFVSNIIAEGSVNGVDYTFPVQIINATTESYITAITAVGSYLLVLPPSLKTLRIRSTSHASGSALISLRGGKSNNFNYVKLLPTTTTVTTTGASGASVTATIPAVTALFHYITRIRISKYVAANLTPAVTPAIATTTNILGSPSFDFKTLGSLGDSEVLDIDFSANPLKSAVASTNSTIVCPVLTGAIWKISVFYYLGA